MKDLSGLLDHAQDWATRAEAFILKNGWSLTDENRPYVIQMTSIYLLHMDELMAKCAVKLQRKECYVVHSQDNDWRFQTSSYKVAFDRFKAGCSASERVGLFHWDSRCVCRRLHASDNYTLTRDY